MNDLQTYGTMKEPILESVEGRFSDVISPGDRVITFTQRHRATKIDVGIFRGVIKEMQSMPYPRDWTYYVVERSDGRRTKLMYNGMVLPSTTLENLIGHEI